MAARGNSWAAPPHTHALNEDELNALCRQRGIFPHHLEEWLACFAPVDLVLSKGSICFTLQLAKYAELHKELNRKEKALARMEVLPALQKKFQALWADEEK